MVNIGMLIADRYEILEKIGTGGMSDVYKAKDHKLNRLVAVKMLKAEFSENADFVSKFRVEAQAAAGLMHPNIVNVYDVGEEKGLYYFVMELVEGITLKKYIEKKARLSVKEAVSIAIQVSMGLEAAHRNHVIHRDIKPQNIIISKDGKVKVTDFGIAKAATSNTITSNVMGSVHYTSPEQARGGYSDEKSDIYSLGITMFEMLTGRVPFNGETTVAIAIKHIQSEMPSPCDFVPEIPRSVEQIVLKCCEKSPDRRYQNISDLISDLKQSLLHPDDDFVKVIRDSDESATVTITARDRERIRKVENAAAAEAAGEMTETDAYPEEEEYPEDEGYPGGYTDEPYYEEDDEGYYPEESYPEERFDDLSEDFDRDYVEEDEYEPPVPKKKKKQKKAAAPARQQAPRKQSARQQAERPERHEAARTGSYHQNETRLNNRRHRSAYEEFDEAYGTAGSGVKWLNLLIVLIAVFIGIVVILFAANRMGILHFGAEREEEEGSAESASTVIVVEQEEPSGEEEEDEGVRVQVPDLSKREKSEARVLLSKKGFDKINILEEPSDTVEKGFVITQDPAADEKVPIDTTITITISTGPDTEGLVRMPDLTYKEEDLVLELLRHGGLKAGEISYIDTDDMNLRGKVITQSIPEGEYVEPDTAVDLVIGNASYMYAADIYAPTPQEDPYYVPGSTVYVIIKSSDGHVLLDKLISSFPYPVSYKGLSVPDGTLEMAYTNVMGDGTQMQKSLVRSLQFTPEN